MKDSAAHRESGLHRLLEWPVIYRLLQRALGADRGRRRFVDQYLDLERGMRVLDFGCGPADLVGHLPAGIDYLGVDFNPRYVAAARRRWGRRARFAVGSAGEVADAALGGPFDLVLLVALLHHLEDDAAGRVIAQARRILAPGGRLVTLDNVFTPSQSRIARYLIERDRGARVRTPEAYVALLRGAFPQVEWEVREDLLRVPYTHFLARASFPSDPGETPTADA